MEKSGKLLPRRGSTWLINIFKIKTIIVQIIINKNTKKIISNIYFHSIK